MFTRLDRHATVSCGVGHCPMVPLLAPKPRATALPALVLLILIERDPKGVLRGRS